MPESVKQSPPAPDASPPPRQQSVPALGRAEPLRRVPTNLTHKGHEGIRRKSPRCSALLFQLRLHYRPCRRSRLRQHFLTSFEMLLAEMGVGAFSPAPDKVVIQSRADQRAYNRNQPPRPFLDKFTARFGRNPLNDSRHQLLDHILLEQLTTQVQPRSAGGGNPQLRYFLICVVFETINQAQFLNGTRRNSRQNAEVGNNGEQPSQSEPCAFRSRHLHCAVNYFFRHRVQYCRLDPVHSMKAGHRQTMSSA